MSVCWLGTIESFIPPENGLPTLFNRRVLFNGGPVTRRSSRAPTADGDQSDRTDDSGGADSDTGDEQDANAVKRPSESQIKRRRVRVILNTRGRIPFLHVGLRVTLAMREQNDFDAGMPCYDVLQCISYFTRSTPPTSSMLSKALSDPYALMFSRAEKRKVALKEATSSNIRRSEYDLKNSREKGKAPQVDAGSSAAIGAIKPKLAEPASLGYILQSVSAPTMVTQREQLQRAMEGYFTIVDATTLRDARPAIVRTLATIVNSPHSVPASIIEQLNVRDLRAMCARASRANQYDDAFVEAVFANALPLGPYPQVYRLGMTLMAPYHCNAPSCGDHVECSDDFLAHHWPTPQLDVEMLRPASVVKLLRCLPIGKMLDYLQNAHEHFDRVSSSVRFGATFFECDEYLDTSVIAPLPPRKAPPKKPTKKTKKKKTADSDTEEEEAAAGESSVSEEQPIGQQTKDSDDADSSSSEDGPIGETVPVQSNTEDRRESYLYTRWLMERGYVWAVPETLAAVYAMRKRPKRLSEEECLAEAMLEPTPLVCTARARRTAQRLASAFHALGKRLDIVSVDDSCAGVLAQTANTLRAEIIESVELLSIRRRCYRTVLLVSPSKVHMLRLAACLSDDDASRYSVRLCTRSDLLAQQVCLVALGRIVLLDAHEWCEHDMCRTLDALDSTLHPHKYAPIDNGASESDGDDEMDHCEQPLPQLSLVGTVDAYPSDSHRESGAPFRDLCAAVSRENSVFHPCRLLPLAVHDQPASLSCASRAKRAPFCAVHMAEELSRDSISSNDDVRAALCDMNRGAHWHVLGAGAKSALSDALSLLADVLPADDHPTDASRLTMLMRTELVRLSKFPFLARSTVFFTAPYVRIGASIVRVRRFYKLVRQETRTGRVTVVDNLVGLVVLRAGVAISLDTIGLYLELDKTTAHDIGDGLDHRMCCFTDTKNLLCVARHRSRITSASFALARDASSAHAIAPRAILVARVDPTMPDRIIERGIDARQLLATTVRQYDPLHLPPEDWRTKTAVLGARTALVPDCAPQYERRLSFVFDGPQSMLGEFLNPTVVDSASRASAMVDYAVTGDDDDFDWD